MVRRVVHSYGHWNDMLIYQVRKRNENDDLVRHPWPGFSSGMFHNLRGITLLEPVLMLKNI